jgi:hypothetical protein
VHQCNRCLLNRHGSGDNKCGPKTAKGKKS